MCISPNPLKQQVRRLAFLRHVDSMDPRCVTFKVHEAIERELPTSDVGEWAALAGLKLVVPVEVALQRKLTAEDVLSFMQGQRGVAKAVQTLERPALEWELTSKWRAGFQAFRFDINIRRVVIRRACRSIILPRSTGFSRTPLLAGAQRDQIVNDGDLPIQVPIVFGGRWRVEEDPRDARSFLEGILDRGRRRLNGGEDGVVDGYLREHVLHRSCRVVVGLQLRLQYAPFLFEQAIDVPLDLLVFVVDRLTFCSVNEVELFADLVVEVLLMLAQLLDACILS